MDKLYEVDMSFVFEGKLEVIASSREEVREIINKYISSNLGHVHVGLNEKNIPDWKFDVKSTNKIKSIKKIDYDK